MASPEYMDTYPPGPGVQGFLWGIILLGVMTGMITFGILGDLHGRLKMLRWALLTSMIGTTLQVFARGEPDQVYRIIQMGRLFVGVGVGGLMPLSAAFSAEALPNTGQQELDTNMVLRGTRVAWSVAWRRAGLLCPYVLALLLMEIPKDFFGSPQTSASIFFRIIFGISAVPTLILFLASLGMKESEEYLERRKRNMRALLETLMHGRHVLALIACSGAAFLHDLAYYGVTLFTPLFLASIFQTNTLLDQVLQNIAFMAMGVPGIILSIALLRPLGLRKLNGAGFLLQAGLFSVMSIVLLSTTEGNQVHEQIQFWIFCLLAVAVDFGPNVGTYVLPAVAFPAEVRSTLHGISGAIAKTGVCCTSLFFAHKVEEHQPHSLLAFQAIVCVIGGSIALRYLKGDWFYAVEGDTSAPLLSKKDASENHMQRFKSFPDIPTAYSTSEIPSEILKQA